MNETSKNNTSLFLTCMSGIGEYELNSMGLRMCYLGDHSFDGDYKNCLYLLFDISDNFSHYLEYVLKKYPNYASDYTIDEYSRMVIMKIPAQYHESVKWFKKGRLSKMSGSYMKSTFSKEDSRYLAFIKDPSYKAALEDTIGESIPEGNDYWSAPQAEKEIYNFNSEVFKKKGW